ncbi:MAG TPA: glycosyltransferase [Devosia sp.]|nr:glycosyltransferase [Devosia sp.]
MLVSIIIKTLNEQDTIGLAVESALAALVAYDGEVIVVDSLSTDRTPEIAAAYPVTVLQLVREEDRSCGVGGELGYRQSRGKYVYMLDGDMELQSEFLESAIAYLETNENCAGVGGKVVERNLVGLEYISRERRRPEDASSNSVKSLPGGGLYRRQAIDQIGYFTNPNLHSYEELELGSRLRSHGWVLARLGMISVFHRSSTIGAYRLLGRKWRGHYFEGSGELLRSALGRRHLVSVLREANVYAISAGLATWVLLGLVVVGVLFGASRWAALGVGLLWLLAPIALMSLKKRSVKLGIYSMVTWSMGLVGLVRGFFRNSAIPTAAIASRELPKRTRENGH